MPEKNFDIALPVSPKAVAVLGLRGLDPNGLTEDLYDKKMPTCVGRQIDGGVCYMTAEADVHDNGSATVHIGCEDCFYKTSRSEGIPLPDQLALAVTNRIKKVTQAYNDLEKAQIRFKQS